MRGRMVAIATAFVALSMVQFLGVTFFYGPIASAPPTGEPLIPRGLGFAISTLLLVLFFDWVNQQMAAPIKAAMTIAISQMLLVDVDYVLSGDRTVAAGAASAVLLLMSWGLVGFLYRAVVKPAPARRVGT